MKIYPLQDYRELKDLGYTAQDDYESAAALKQAAASAPDSVALVLSQNQGQELKLNRFILMVKKAAAAESFDDLPWKGSPEELQKDVLATMEYLQQLINAKDVASVRAVVGSLEKTVNKSPAVLDKWITATKGQPERNAAVVSVRKELNDLRGVVFHLIRIGRNFIAEQASKQSPQPVPPPQPSTTKPTMPPRPSFVGASGTNWGNRPTQPVANPQDLQFGLEEKLDRATDMSSAFRYTENFKSVLKLYSVGGF